MDTTKPPKPPKPPKPHKPEVPINDEVSEKCQDYRPRIWCARCNARHCHGPDAKRHFQQAHPEYVHRLALEQPQWMYEIYANSRHGNNQAARIANKRNIWIMSYNGEGIPCEDGELGPITQYMHLVENLKGVRSRDVERNVDSMVKEIAPIIGPIRQAD